MKINNAEIICVGTELLLGEVVNTNAAVIGSSLAELGISVYHSSVVGDNSARLKEAISSALSRADLVILSGGLGPTYDDLTKESVAELLGKKMVRDESILAGIEAYFAKTGRKMTENNKKQADIPEGAIALENPVGTAPGVYIELDSAAVAMLPGPPRELVPMLKDQLIPRLKPHTDTVIYSKNIHVMGMGESEVESILSEMMKKSSNPTVAPYAKEGEVRLRVCASAKSEDTARLMCDEVIEKIKMTSVGDFIYGIDCASIENALFQKLKEKGMTIAVAESCTGGLIAKRMTDLPGVSSVFLGGCVTYTNQAKMKLLSVSEKTLSEHSAVSEQAAIEMARGARLALGADVGVSTTGIAGPSLDPLCPHPIGTVFIGISTKNEEYAKKLSLSDQRSRDYIRIVASSRAMMEIYKKL